MPQNYLEQLNDAQRKAVEYLGGPELVIAGAGSGKTRVLTYKIMHLLTMGYEPWRIMALTFTNKAADEMRQRVAMLVGEDMASGLWMGTFHSVFARILRRHAGLLGFSSNFTIYDAADTKSLLRSIIREMGLQDTYKPGNVANEISNAKNNLVSPEDYMADKDIRLANTESGQKYMGDIYRTYCQRCKVSDAMDFDDLLFFTNVLLRDNPEVLGQYQTMFRYILVDEYQDTNFAQHLIVRQIAGNNGMMCVVGDDAQSIYSFRGANIRNILNLQKHFPKLETFKLERNYRSTGNIVEAANSLIEKNRQQIPKEIYSRNGSGERIEVTYAYDQDEEGRIVANSITRQRMRSGDRYSDMAVLYRTNAQSRVFEEALRNRNIPYRVYGGLAFYQRREIKDAIAYFRLAVNPNDDEALRRAINTPKRGIGTTTVEKIAAAAGEAAVSMYAVLLHPERYGCGFSKGTLARLRDFAAMLGVFIEMNADGADAAIIAKEVYERTGLYRQYVVDGNSPENISKRDNMDELLRSVQARSEEVHSEAPDSVLPMAEFLARVSLLTDADIQDDGTDSVTLMTIHSAKGLEFDSVFVVGVEEDILPSAISKRGPGAAMEIEEERRLLYVAITRAKRFCMLTYAGKRIVNGKFVRPVPSRFLSDIDRSYLHFAAGRPIMPPAERPEPRRPLFTAPLRPAGVPQPLPVVPAPAPAAQLAVSGDAGFCKHTAGELRPGMRIHHLQLGEGTVVSVNTDEDDHSFYADFSGTRRKLLLKYATFKIL